MANPALQYAEVTLGVHTCYEKAEAAHKELDEIVLELDKAQDEKRYLTDQLADKEMDLLIAERGKHADMSGAELERHMKIVKHKDTDLIQLRQRLLAVGGRVNGLEYDADVQKQSIKIQTARMEELGGYFRYLAAIKEAENLIKRQNLISQENVT